MALGDAKPVPQRKINWKGTAMNMTDNYEPDYSAIFTDGRPQMNPGAVSVGGEYNWTTNNNGQEVTTTATAPRNRSRFLSRMLSKDNLNTVATTANNVVDQVAPFATNIVNSFRRAPMPRRGKFNEFTPLQKINLSDERTRVGNRYAAANRATERNVDSNTAEAIKAFNRGSEMADMSAISERESNTNVAISNQQAQMDAATKAANTAIENDYRESLTAREIASIREKSENFANAMDKTIAIRNQKTQSETELAKARVLSMQFSQSGVVNRLRQRAKQSGEPDPLGLDYKDLDKKQFGGRLGVPKRKMT